jgi:hypothetical protein
MNSNYYDKKMLKIMKKFLITLAVSIVIILGIWIIPEMNNYEKYEVAEEFYPEIILDTIY